MTQAVSKVKFSAFMDSFTNITLQAFREKAASRFFVVRGIKAENMQLTKYTCVDQRITDVLQEVIEASTERIKDVEKQKSLSQAEIQKLEADIALATQETQLLKTQARNKILQAQTEGEALGFKELEDAQTFLDGLNETVPNVDDRVALLTAQEKTQARSEQIHNLNTGKLNVHHISSSQDMTIIANSVMDIQSGRRMMADGSIEDVEQDDGLADEDDGLADEDDDTADDAAPTTASAYAPTPSPLADEDDDTADDAAPTDASAPADGCIGADGCISGVYGL